MEDPDFISWVVRHIKSHRISKSNSELKTYYSLFGEMIDYADLEYKGRLEEDEFSDGADENYTCLADFNQKVQLMKTDRRKSSSKIFVNDSDVTENDYGSETDSEVYHVI